MRTKTLLLLAAAAAAGTMAANAQVYSINAVGYVNTTIPAKSFGLISNPLNASDNKISSILTGLPDSSQLFLWNTTNKKFDLYTFIEGAGWDPDPGPLTLVPGQGAFLKNPSANPITITFVGEVPTGPLNTALLPGFQIVSSQVPQAGTLEQLGFGLSAQVAGGATGPQDGDKVYKWNASTAKYVLDSYTADAGWDNNLQFGVGEAFFLSRSKAGAWTRTFTIN